MAEGLTADGRAPARRYHGLDGLRGFAMLLGIVVHASLPYFSRLLEYEYSWPADDDQSLLLYLVFAFIHAWRMPVFFVMAGFFAHLVLGRRPVGVFVRDRLKRIALPLVLFGTVMAALIPPLWVYGWTGEMSAETFWKVTLATRDAGASGQLVAHLWFLYYLLIMYAALLAFRSLATRDRVRRWLGSGFWAGLRRHGGNALYARFPLLLALAGIALLILRAGDGTKSIWPLNVPDFLHGALFFFFGYGLFARRELIDRLKDPTILVALWFTAAASFFAHLVALSAIDDAVRQAAPEETVDTLRLLAIVFNGTAGAMSCVGLIGLFELVFQSPQRWVRWLADSSYWIYIAHLPVVAFLTFWIAHLDRQGRLEFGIGLSLGAESKFLAACLLTGAICVLSYRYLVRYTLVGALLNGPRERVRAAPR